MKKMILMMALLMGAAYGVKAQTAPAGITVDMEQVSKIGGNATYDDENCQANFTGQWNRWLDLPGVEGDISATPTLQMEILKSNVVLKVVAAHQGGRASRSPRRPRWLCSGARWERRMPRSLGSLSSAMVTLK